MQVTAYKFVAHDVGPKPDSETTRLLEKAVNLKAPTRSEKDRIADILYGTFGAQSSTYKVGGWAWPMRYYLPRFLVNLKFYGWKEYYAADKTSLRNVFGHRALEIVAAPCGGTR